MAFLQRALKLRLFILTTFRALEAMGPASTTRIKYWNVCSIIFLIIGIIPELVIYEIVPHTHMKLLSYTAMLRRNLSHCGLINHTKESMVYQLDRRIS